ncbi:pimeloyl-ACP methyl ester carboxylesterase [Mycoplasmoides fastidiosum]|uniref:Pimeloyl-ACP methyl ester carboxylesterase n=1 Tax=Mycoplasmoides fastidiosum TaxID=92758 RepID=A0ABU0LYS3_9BACT|nr:alpha/beta hydrolase [Mycoplasmoides fastidiosum]MDQ0513834.1 pimeloyl-ACP methyl ester carboxylesterase [Mycoplasmoides fastidiosum]UUD37750.1 alpha/beta hydrolase [Mycoplasmoides fastidiosum]
MANFDFHFKNNQKPENPILFIHGFWSSYKAAFGLLNLITDNDFYGLNLPGHGSPIRTRPLDFEQLIEATIEFIQFQNLKNISIIAHSMGGGVAAVVSSRVPNLIKNVTLISPLVPAEKLKNRDWEEYFFADTFEKYRFLYESLYAKGKESTSNPAFLRGLQRRFEIEGRHNSHMLDLYHSLKSDATFAEILVGYQKNSLPFFVITGEKDPICPSDILREFFNTYVKDLQFVELNNIAHVAMIEDPETVYQLFMKFNNSNINYE